MDSRKVVALFLTTIVSISILGVSETFATSSKRIGGLDRYETAALVAEEVFKEGLAGSTVLLTTGENYPDALAAGAWGGEAAILLTKAKSLPEATRRFLANEWIEKVVVIGGPAAVSESIETEVASIVPEVERVWGVDRYETSVAISRSSADDQSASVIYLAPGTSFGDQLVAVAAARSNSGSFLIVPPGRQVSEKILQEISRLKKTPDVKVTIFDSASSLDLDLPQAEHFTGDLFEMNNYSQPVSDSIILASGENWPDALGGSRLIKEGRGMILTRQLCASHTFSSRFLGDQRVGPSPSANNLLILGGTSAISADAAAALPCPDWHEIRSRYSDVALNCEFGPCDFRLKRPVGAIAVRIVSDYRLDQGTAVVHAMSEWNRACPEIPMAPFEPISTVHGEIRSNWTGGNGVPMSVGFASDTSLRYYVDYYEEGNKGLFSYRYSSNFEIQSMKVAISNSISGTDLLHLVLEEMTQSMGLVNDVYDAESIFNQAWGGPTTYSNIDYETVRLHCSVSVRTGMSSEDIPFVWSRLRNRSPLWVD